MSFITLVDVRAVMIPYKLLLIADNHSFVIDCMRNIKCFKRIPCPNNDIGYNAIVWMIIITLADVCAVMIR